ncbi:MAG: hypothetical protein OEY28_11385, partial [Nitrospira sp.]|nr:hypothetical protein [Nitrospira sp.]
NVLRAMGVPVAALHGSVRFSLGWDTTEEEIDYVLTEVPPMIERLRELSPLEPPTGTGTGPEEDLKAHKEYFTGSPTQQLR